MEGFEGYKPDEAIANLNAFSEAVYSIYLYAKEQVSIYNTNLVENWCSPKAVECDLTMRGPSYIGAYLDNMRELVMRKAISAYKTIARYNGDSFEYEFTTLGGDLNSSSALSIDGDKGYNCYEWVPLKESSSKHGVGMNKDNVRIIVDELKKTAEKIKNDLDSLPINFAGYDENNEIKESYNNLIEKHKALIINEITSACSKVESCYETERDNVSMGSKLAVEELRA